MANRRYNNKPIREINHAEENVWMQCFNKRRLQWKKIFVKSSLCSPNGARPIPVIFIERVRERIRDSNTGIVNAKKRKEWKQAWLADKWRVLSSYTHDYVYSFRNHKKEEVKFEQKSVSRRTDVPRTLWIDKAWRVSTANTLRLEYIYFLWPTNIMLKALKWKQ